MLGHDPEKWIPVCPGASAKRLLGDHAQMKRYLDQMAALDLVLALSIQRFLSNIAVADRLAPGLASGRGGLDKPLKHKRKTNVSVKRGGASAVPLVNVIKT
jgi:hypothetical protein